MKAMTMAFMEDQLLYRLREGVDAGDIGLWDLHLDLGAVHFSPSWKVRLGLPDPDLADSIHGWRCRVHPQDLETMLAAMRAHVRGSARSYDAYFRFRSNGSGYRQLHSRGRVLQRDRDGRPCRLIGTSIDLTPRPSTPGVGIPDGPRAEMSFRLPKVPFHQLLDSKIMDRGLISERDQALQLVDDLVQDTLQELENWRKNALALSVGPLRTQT